jgi:hypothetical protein
MFGHPSDIETLNQYLPGIGPNQAEDKLQNRGFSGTASTQNNLGFASINIEANVIEDYLIIKRLGDVSKFDHAFRNGAK